MMTIRRAYSFNDLLLVPQYSEVSTRKNVDVSVKIKDYNFSSPLIAANMKNISGLEMCRFVTSRQGLAISHRFQSHQEQLDIYTSINSPSKYFSISVGVNNDLELVEKFADLGGEIVTIDIAHGDSKHCHETCKSIKKIYGNRKNLLIAGNVATGKAAQRLFDSGADIVKAGIGAGCFAAGTRVLMSNGFYKNIEDIKVGDYVIGGDGNPVKVLDSFCTGIRKTIKLRTNLWYTNTYVTPDHNFFVGDFNTSKDISSTGYSSVLDLPTRFGKSKYKWKPISETKKDVCLLPNKINFNIEKDDFRISILKKYKGNGLTYNIDDYKEDVVLTPSYELGYIFGTFLGDGTASLATVKKGTSKIGSTRWYFNKTEQNIVDKLSICLKKYIKEPSIKPRNNVIVVTMHHKPFTEFMDSFGKRTEKHLPEELFVNNKDYLKGIFNGLCDSDGCYGKNGRTTITNTSKRVIELFMIIETMLSGIMPNTKKEKKDPGGLKNINKGNFNTSYVAETLKNGKVRLTKDYQVVKILEKEDLEIEVPVYDITVDSEDHSFIANNMIVHNSLCSTRIVTGNGVPQMTAIMDVKESLKPNQFFISDGGIKTAGDCVKSLCFADMVMIGSMLAGTSETPGKSVYRDGKPYKSYEGSSTFKARVEGIKSFVPVKGSASEVFEQLIQGIQSGCSYQGVDNLVDLKENPELIEISTAGYIESAPHIHISASS